MTSFHHSRVTTMYKYALLAAIAITGLAACSQQDESAQQPTEQVAAVTKPSDPNDSKAWNAYLGQIVQKNMQGMTAERPYPYLVPAGDSDDANALRQRQLEQVQDTVARGVLPGNMLVFAGPDSAKTSQFVADAFKDAKAGAFKDVIVLVIGDAGDKDKVTATLQPTGATIRYVNM
ncbi:hypothetical protein [Dyella kyungheensis]|jgi:hypothetical protein